MVAYFAALLVVIFSITITAIGSWYSFVPSYREKLRKERWNAYRGMIVLTGGWLAVFLSHILVMPGEDQDMPRMIGALLIVLAIWTVTTGFESDSIPKQSDR